MKKLLSSILVAGSVLATLGFGQVANADNVQSNSTPISFISTEPATAPIHIRKNIYQVSVQNVVDFNALVWLHNELAQTNGQYRFDRSRAVGIVHYSNATVYSLPIKDSQGNKYRMTLRVIQDPNAPVQQLHD